jgi:hypothetical protein
MTATGPPAAQRAEGVKGLRLLLSADGTFFKVARITWSVSDSSVWVPRRSSVLATRTFSAPTRLGEAISTPNFVEWTGVPLVPAKRYV